MINSELGRGIARVMETREMREPRKCLTGSNSKRPASSKGQAILEVIEKVEKAERGYNLSAVQKLEYVSK